MGYAPYLVWWLLVTLVALSVVDAWSSWILLHRHGVESNMFARFMIAQLGLAGALLLRVLIGCLVAWSLACCIQLRPVRSTLFSVGALVLCINLWWGFTCINNLALFAKS